MAMPVETRTRWTAAAVRELMERTPEHSPTYELVDGELLVMPAPALPHERALQWLHRVLDAYLQQQPVGELLGSPSDLELEPETIVRPDRFVIPREEAAHARRWSDVSRLLLAVEVLSPSTARYDRGPKRELYQRVGVEEYWIIDLDARLAERWRPGDERPEILRQQLVWHPAGATSPLVIELAELFAAARLD